MLYLLGSRSIFFLVLTILFLKFILLLNVYFRIIFSIFKSSNIEALDNCVGIYRLENTLNYGLERVWAIGYMKSSRR